VRLLPKGEMMRKVWLFACALFFVSVVSFAQTPSPPPLTNEALAAILGQPVAGACAARTDGPREVAKRPARLGEKSVCNATAKCQLGAGSVSCSGNGTNGCSSVDSNCAAGQPGYATCDGVTHWCPPCAECVGTCFSSVQCYAVCSAGGADPTTYPCDLTAHCCICRY